MTDAETAALRTENARLATEKDDVRKLADLWHSESTKANTAVTRLERENARLAGALGRIRDDYGDVWGGSRARGRGGSDVVLTCVCCGEEATEAVGYEAIAHDEDCPVSIARAALAAVPMLSLGEPALDTPSVPAAPPGIQAKRGESCAHLCATCRVVGCAWCNVGSDIIAEGRCFSCRRAIVPADASRVPMPSGTGADVFVACLACKGTGARLNGEGMTAAFSTCSECGGAGEITNPCGCSDPRSDHAPNPPHRCWIKGCDCKAFVPLHSTLGTNAPPAEAERREGKETT